VHVITNPLSIWITSVTKLKEFMDMTPPFKIIACGGDQNASLYLYKQDVIFDAIFKRIDICSKDELVNILLELLSKEVVC
jgi:hypothetical protein